MMPSKTLVIGLPGSGKTTWVKEHLEDGVAYDLDHILAALRLTAPHEDDNQNAVKLANALLKPCIDWEGLSCDLYVIRTAPTIAEFTAIAPDRLVVMQTAYSIRERQDFSELDEETLEKLNSRINACTKRAESLGIPIKRIT